MEPNAPRDVIHSTLLTSLTGVGVGTLYGLWKTRKGGSWSTVTLASGATGFNLGVHGLAFFAIREYVTTPLLMQTVPWALYIRRREWLAQNKRSTGAWSPELLESYPHAVTFSELRLDKLADSTITGAVLGGATNVFRRGRTGIVSGVVTGTLFCSTLQFAWNELNVLRVRFVYHARGKSKPFPSDAPENDFQPKTLSESILDTLAVVFPLQKLSDEEYLERLVTQKGKVEARMEDIRKEVEEMEQSQNDAEINSNTNNA